MASCSQICLDQGGSQSIHLVGSICLVAAKVFRIQYLDFNIWPKPLTAFGYSPRASKFWFRPLLPPIESGTWPSDCSCNCMHAAFVGQHPPSIYPTRLATCMYPPYTDQVTALTFYTIRPLSALSHFYPKLVICSKVQHMNAFPSLLLEKAEPTSWIWTMDLQSHHNQISRAKGSPPPLNWTLLWGGFLAGEEVKTEIKIFAAKSENRVGAGKAQDQR